MCELARNSCAQSGFEMEIKRHWLGPDWYLPGREGNLIHKTNVPNLRADYRWSTLREEMDMVRAAVLFCAGHFLARGKLTLCTCRLNSSRMICRPAGRPRSHRS